MASAPPVAPMEVKRPSPTSWFTTGVFPLDKWRRVLDYNGVTIYVIVDMIDRFIGDKKRFLKGSSNFSVLIMDNYGAVRLLFSAPSR